VYADNIAVDVMGELHNQRASLLRTKDRVSNELSIIVLYNIGMVYKCVYIQCWVKFHWKEIMHNRH